MVVEFSSGKEASGYGVLPGWQGEHDRGRRSYGADDCQVRRSGEGGRRGGRHGRPGRSAAWDVSRFGCGGEEDDDGEIIATRGGSGDGGEERLEEGVYERSDGGGAAHAAAEPADGATGEASADDEARHGEGEFAPGELRGGESAVQPEFGQGLFALRIAELSAEGRAGDAGEPHDAAEDDDAESRRLVVEPMCSIEEEFAHHKPGLARVNNGSFGSCPKSVLAAQAAWFRWWLRQPDGCYFGPLEAQLLRARQEVANLIHAPVEEVFLLENVTASASMVALDVMWSFAEGRYSKGDAILMLNFTYGAMKKAFQVSLSLRPHAINSSDFNILHKRKTSMHP